MEFFFSRTGQLNSGQIYNSIMEIHNYFMVILLVKPLLYISFSYGIGVDLHVYMCA